MLILISKCMFVYGIALLKIFEVFYIGLISPSFSVSLRFSGVFLFVWGLLFVWFGVLFLWVCFWFYFSFLFALISPFLETVTVC